MPPPDPSIRLTLSELREWGAQIAEDAARRVLASRADRPAVRSGGLAPPLPTLPTREAAARAGVSVKTVRRWVRDGKVDARHVGGRAGYLVDVESLDAYVAGRTS